MILIAHRGNIHGPNPESENNPKYIDDALSQGFNVEVDVRCIEGNFYLGHDESQYSISVSWLRERKDNFWVHCKNLEAMEFFSNSLIDFNYFWHQEDDFTLTSKRYIWTYPGKPHTIKSIIVMPELIESFNYEKLKDCYGVCSDYVGKLK